MRRPLARFAALAIAFTTAIAAATSLPPGFVDDQFVAGFSGPTCMAFAPDGRLFVCEQGGALKIASGTTVTTALTLAVDASGERGLLGIEFDPAFASDGFIYLYHTVPGSPAHNRVSRYTMAGNVVAAGSEVVVFDLDPLSSATNHNGGSLHLGGDGKLYVAAGENANGANAQSLGTVLGKLLRLNLDGSIPADNPLVAQTTGKNQAIWAYGLRNPFTFAFRDDGLLFINDVGENTWEEIDVGRAGANYGWPITEGTTTDPRFVGPLVEYGHGSSASTGCAITGGVFYPRAGGSFPASYAGKYFFSDFCGSWIRMVDPATGAASGFALGVVSGVVDLDVRGGDLYYLTRGEGSVHRVRYAPARGPFGGVARAIPGTVQAEDFDEGGEGVAYHDSDPGNDGGGYRDTAVDIRTCYEAGGGWQVGWFGAGEWLEYTISAASDATYEVGVRVASWAGGATIHVSIDGVDRTGPMAFADTGSWDSFTTAVHGGVAIAAGMHIVRLTCDAGALDANWLSFEPSGIVPGQWYKLVAEHSGRCLDVSGASALDGANVQQWSDNGTTAQQWRIDANADGSYTLIARCSGKALDVSGWGLDDGVNIIQWLSHGGANQRWWISDTGGGWYRLTNVNSGKVVDVEGISTAEGANVHQWTDWGGANQRWAIIAVAPTVVATAEAVGPDAR